jgi:hypothetical protein
MSLVLPVREDIIREIHARLSQLTGTLVLRNPKVPPKAEDLPAVSIIYEEDDEVVNDSLTGDYPQLDHRWPIKIIPYMIGSDGTDETAETEIHAFCDDVRREIWRGGASLSGKCAAISQANTGGRLIKPHIGEAGIGLPMTFLVIYTEDTEQLFY